MQIIRQKIKKATSTPIGKIIFFSILILILAGIAGGLIYWQTHKKQIIREQLESAIHGKSNGLYTIHYDSLDLDEVSGYLFIKNLTLIYDSSKYLALREQDKTPPILLKIHIPEITVTGVKTPKALLDKEIQGTKLELKNPDIEIIYTLEGKDSSRSVPDKQVYEQLLGNLNMISIDTVLMTGAHIRTSKLKNHEEGFEFINSAIRLVNLRIDSIADADTTRILFSRQVALGCEKATCLSANKLYKYIMEDLSLNSAEKRLTVKKFLLDPQLDENAFVKKLPAQEDRFDFTVQDIAIKNLDFLNAAREDIRADSLIIGSATFKIYRDLNITRDTKNRVGTYPQQAIDRIPIPIEIKKIVLQNGFVEYKERNKITKEAGKVQFYNIYTSISNLTNKKETIAGNNKMIANISSSFMNKTPFKTTWVFYLQNPNGSFDLEGNMGAIDVKDVNVLTEPMGPARLEDGKINSVYFNLHGTDYTMGGTVKMLYEDLKVSLLERDKDTKELDKKGLTSFVANILIKNANPGKNKEVRVADISYKRDTNRSIFNMAWKTIFQDLDRQ